MTDAIAPRASATLSPAASPTMTGAAKPAAPVDQLRSVARQFEAVFLRQMIGSMRTASLGDGILDSSATQQFRDMSDAKLADNMADTGVLHIADLLVSQFGARLGGSAATADANATMTKGEPR